MDVIKKFKVFLGIFIPILAFFLMSQNTFAAQYNSWLNIQDVSKTNLSNDWITHNSPNAGSYSISGSTTLKTYRVLASASLPSSVSGAYFSASGTIYFDIPSSLEGGLSCSFITEARIVPEYTSYNNLVSRVTSCSLSTPNIYTKRYSIAIETTGSIPSQTSFTTFYFSISSSSQSPFIDLVGTPNDSPRVFISGDVNITISSTPELEGLGVINQNITIISNELKEYHDREYEAIENIEDQSTSDIQGATNEQTTTLIGILTNFVSSITNVRPTSSCRLNLNFPAFAGGTQTVDPCIFRQNTIINIFSSVVTVTFFIPLAYVLLKMIYNEIRSWTNG